MSGPAPSRRSAAGPIWPPASKPRLFHVRRTARSWACSYSTAQTGGLLTYAYACADARAPGSHPEQPGQGLVDRPARDREPACRPVRIAPIARAPKHGLPRLSTAIVYRTQTITDAPAAAPAPQPAPKSNQTLMLQPRVIHARGGKATRVSAWVCPVRDPSPYGKDDRPGTHDDKCQPVQANWSPAPARGRHALTSRRPHRRGAHDRGLENTLIATRGQVYARRARMVP